MRSSNSSQSRSPSVSPLPHRRRPNHGNQPHDVQPRSLMDQHIPSTSTADLLPWGDPLDPTPSPSHLRPGSSSSSIHAANRPINKIPSLSATTAPSAHLPPPRRSVSDEGRLAATSSSIAPTSGPSSLSTPTPRRTAPPRSPNPRAPGSAGGLRTVSPSEAKYDMKRLLSKPAPPSSSLGSSFFSSGSPGLDNPLSLSVGSYGSASDSSSFLRSAGREFWSPDTPASTLGNPLPDLKSTSTTTRSHQSSTAAYATSPRARTVTQSSVNSYASSTSSFRQPSDNDVNSSSSRLSPLRGDTAPPPRALTPASAIAYAYQHQQRSATTPSPSPGLGPPSATSPRAFDDAQYYDDPQTFTSPRAVPDHHVIRPSPSQHTLATKKSSTGLKGLTRKVSGKFSKRPTSSRKHLEEPVVVGSLGSSFGSAGGGSYLAGVGDFGEASGSVPSSTRGPPSWLDEPSADYYHVAPPPPPSPPLPRSGPRRLLKSKSQNFLRASASRSASGPPTTPNSAATQHAFDSVPSTPQKEKESSGIWKLVKKFSSSTLREKPKPLSPLDPSAPPVPPLPSNLATSPNPRYSISDDPHDYGVVLESSTRYGEFGERPSLGGYSASSSAFTSQSGKSIGRSRSGTVVSSQQSHHQIPPVPIQPRSPRHGHKRSTSQSRGSATALSSSPISSDMSSFRWGRRGFASPRTSTSSYVPSDTVHPPLPSQKPPHHILAPDTIVALLDYDPIDGSVDQHSVNDGVMPRRSFASHTPTAEHHRLGPPSRKSTDRSRSREPPSSRKSSNSAKRDGSPDSKSVRSLKKSGTANPPPSLPLISSNLLSARTVIVQGDITPEGESTPSVPTFTSSPEATPSLSRKNSTGRKGLLQRLGRSKSEAQITPPPPQAPSEPVPSLPCSSSSQPASPPRNKRWSISDNNTNAHARRVSGGPLSPSRAKSFHDSPSNRPPSFSTTVAFRELTTKSVVKRSEHEKMRMWDQLMEKSERAGGTIHAKVALGAPDADADSGGAGVDEEEY